MAQHDYDIANQSGSAFRADLNNALAAIVTNNSGASAPSTTFAHQLWIDTSTNPATMKRRDASNASWITVGTVDGSGTFPLGSVSAPSFTFTGDTNTGIYSPGADQLAITTGGSGRLFVDATGRVGIGATSAGYNLEVVSGDTTAGLGYALRLRANATALAAALQFTNNAGGTQYGFIAVDSSSNIKFGTATSEQARITNNGAILAGITTARANFNNATLSPRLQVESSNAEISITRNAADASGSALILGKSRSSGNTVVVNGDRIGAISFQGNDATEFVEAAAIYGEVDAVPGANDMPGRLVFATTGDGAAATTERARITQGGIINLSGQRGTALTIPMPGSGNIRMAAASAGGIACSTYDIQDYTAVQFVRDVSGSANQVGSITCTTAATAYNTSSDYRLKENITILDGAIDRIKEIPVHRFNFIADPGNTIDGFLAHEVQEVVPEAITGTKDEVDDDGNPVYQGIDQSKLVPLLMAALQEAIAKIEDLETRVATLEAAA